MMFIVISILAASLGDRSFGGLMTMRALQGFFGSPILASGAASIQDVLNLSQAPYGYMVWIAAMYSGPAVSLSVPLS
jgi:MFS transporter, DHA1 family, multidrug resistance protein